MAPMARGRWVPMLARRTVREAANNWARSIFGAPRHFAELIRSVQVRDEVFQRLLTHVVRQDVRERRAPSTERRATPERLDPLTVDPFATSAEALRGASQHVAVCAGCGGPGFEGCATCAFRGRAPCSHCRGNGGEPGDPRRGGDSLNCTVCRGRGTVPCAACSGSGRATCRSCGGSGHETSWLTLEETSRSYVTLLPESAALLAHPQLNELRTLTTGDLAAFGVLGSAEAPGPLPPQDGLDQTFLQAHSPLLDPSLERVSYQQSLTLATIRRDVLYEMCGTQGVLVLSGIDLSASTTPAALRPIRRRAYAWTIVATGIVFGTHFLLGSLLGRTPDFERSNRWVLSSSCLASGLMIAVSGGVLRELRPRLRFGRLRTFERFLGACAAIALFVGLAIAAVSHARVLP
jgi:hypothetical protein